MYGSQQRRGRSGLHFNCSHDPIFSVNDPDDDRIVSHDAPSFMLYYHCVRDTSSSVIFSTSEVNIAVLDVDGFQTCFGSAAFAFEIIGLAYIHYALRENFSVTLTKKGFTCVSPICLEQLVRSVAL